VTGREVVQQDLAMEWSDETEEFGWKFFGSATAQQRTSPIRHEILGLLGIEPDLTPKEIATSWERMRVQTEDCYRGFVERD